MTIGFTAGHDSTALGALLGDDDVLYRAAQGLLCLRATPGRSQRVVPMVVRRAGRWEVLGRLGQTLRVPPLSLGLDAELDQVAHLRTAGGRSLGVESLYDGTILDADLIYEVEGDAVAALTIPVGIVPGCGPRGAGRGIAPHFRRSSRPSGTCGSP